MKLQGPILVGIDFSTASDRALRQGIDLATGLVTNLIVCHVVPELDTVNILFPQLADRTRLQQVFAKLLTNAAKYTDDGGRISLTVQSDGNTATIRILDNGKGISPDALPHVFDLFMQAAEDLRAGLGIGLKVVRALVELHGRTVTAQSDGLGKGSEFRVTLPVVAAPATTESRSS